VQVDISMTHSKATAGAVALVRVPEAAPDAGV
jgi:hypothetical protein